MSADSGPRALWDILHDDANVLALREYLAVGPQDIRRLSERIFGPHDVDLDQTMARLIDAAASARETTMVRRCCRPDISISPRS